MSHYNVFKPMLYSITFVASGRRSC